MLSYCLDQHSSRYKENSIITKANIITPISSTFFFHPLHFLRVNNGLKERTQYSSGIYRDKKENREKTLSKRNTRNDGTESKQRDRITCTKDESLALKKKERTVKDIRREIFWAKPASLQANPMAGRIVAGKLRRRKSFVGKHADNKAPAPI